MSEQTSERPNIVVFLTDDHGPWGAHCLGTNELCTPSMDELARTGTIMRRAYTPTPVCSPGRASFHTGRIASMHGVHDWLSENKGARDHPGILDQPTLAHHLGELGYQSAQIGKWHVGHSSQPQAGFDLWAAFSQGPHFGDVRLWENGNEQIIRGFHDQIVTDRTVRYLREDRDPDRPFFVTVGYTATHSKFDDHPERLVNLYRPVAAQALCDETPDDRHWFIKRGRPESRELELEWHAQYLAACHLIDEGVGRVMDTLKSIDQWENTIIVYTSDHGHNNSHHGVWCKGNTTTPQNFFEESIGVPCIAAWPGQTPGGRASDAMVDHCDLFATLLDAAGADVAGICDRVTSPGRSFLSLLRGKTSEPIKDVQFCEYGNARMARDERYKLIRRYPGPNGHFGDEFYDLHEDPRERDNRIDNPQLAGVVSDLSARLDAHFARYENPEVSGVRVGEFAPTSASEPWRMTGPDEID